MKGVCADEFQDCSEQLEVDELEVAHSFPILSLHAMQGTQGHQTMKLAARIGHLDVILLVDTGSTHNFIDFRLAKMLRVPIAPIDRLKVLTACGDNLYTQGLYRAVTWVTQGYQFSTNFLTLLLKGCDLALGVQWLTSLGSIV